MIAHRFYEPWSKEDAATFDAMRAAGKTRQEIAAALGRSFASVKARVRTVQGYVPPSRKRKAPAVPKRIPTGLPSYQRPAPRQNDDGRHLALIFAAQPHGFPFYDLRAQYRVAA